MSTHPQTESLARHLPYLSLALDEARKCTPTPTAFCVGCVITVPRAGGDETILSGGYSRELPGNTHAEANALEKAYGLEQSEISSTFPDLVGSTSGHSGVLSVDEILRQANVYTTMEPCSVRLSGLSPCADGLIKAKVKRCFIGVGEPDDFVSCEGARKLTEAGIEVIWLKGMEAECLKVARTGHTE